MGESVAPVFDGTQGDRRHLPSRRRPSRVITSGKEAGDGDHDRHKFRRILEEVQELGSSSLSWKERKQLQQKKVLALGGKPAKTIKMPIAMGLSMKRKREKLESERAQQYLLGGVFPSRRKKRVWESDRDRGLMLSEGKFKGGVLYVKRPDSKAADRGDQGRGPRRDTIFAGRTSGAGKPKNDRSKKRKGKNKGGKHKR